MMEYLTLNKLKNQSFALEGYYSTTFQPFDMPYHGHNNFELMYVTEGNCQIYLMDKSNKDVTPINLFDKQFILLNAGVIHRLMIDRKNTRMLGLELKAVPAQTVNVGHAISASEPLRSLIQANKPFYRFNDVAGVEEAIFHILDETANRAVFPEENGYMLQLLISELWIRISRCTENPASATGITYLKKAVNFICENYQRMELSVADIAKHTGISLSYLQKLFKNQFGVTVKDYLNHYRIQKACYLILHPPMTLKMIQEQVGFSSRQHFNYTFRKFTDLTPTDYKKKYLFSELKKKKEGADTEFIEHELEHPNYI